MGGEGEGEYSSHPRLAFGSEAPHEKREREMREQGLVWGKMRILPH